MKCELGVIQNIAILTCAMIILWLTGTGWGFLLLLLWLSPVDATSEEVPNDDS